MQTKYKALKSLYLKCIASCLSIPLLHSKLQRSNISSTHWFIYPKNEMNQLTPDELFDPFQLALTAVSAQELSHKSQLSVLCKILLSHSWDDQKGKHLGGDSVCQIVLCNLTKCFNLINKYRSCLTKQKDTTAKGEGVMSNKSLIKTKNLTSEKDQHGIDGLSDRIIENTWKTTWKRPSVKDFMTHNLLTCTTAPAKVCAQCRSRQTEYE